jgi:hypothetical protein
MSKFWISLALIPLALGVAATSVASPAGNPASAQCEIRATAIPGSLRLEGVVYGVPGDAGSYQLTLARSGPGGTSNVSQGGDYVVDASGEAVVSVSEFNRGARDTLDAVMTIEDSYGVSSCERAYPTR